MPVFKNKKVSCNPLCQCKSEANLKIKSQEKEKMFGESYGPQRKKQKKKKPNIKKMFISSRKYNSK